MQLLVCVLLGLVIGIVADDVVVLTSKNFNKQVIESSLPYFVEFYAPWCGHCKSLEPTWKGVAKQLKGIIPVGKVDATVEGQLAQKYGVRGYPTIKLFVPGEKSPRDYNGQRSAKAIIGYALNSLANRVHTLSTPEKVDKFWQTKADIPHVLLFTSKSKTSPAFLSLATRYAGKLEFGEVREGSDVAGTFEDVEKYPELRVYESKDAEAKVYDGVMKPLQLVEYLGTFAGEPSTEKAKPAETKKAAPKKAPLKGENIIHLESEEEFDAKCGKVCAVGIYEAGSDDESTMTKIHNEFKHDGKLEFLHLDKTLASELPEKFGVEVPGLFVYKSKRKRFSAASDFSYDALHNHLERVLTGDAKFTTLKTE